MKKAERGGFYSPGKRRWEQAAAQGGGDVVGRERLGGVGRGEVAAAKAVEGAGGDAWRGRWRLTVAEEAAMTHGR